MSERLAGKRVIITGGAQGIGRSFVLGLAAAGARVLACDVREEGLRETCARANAEGGVALAVTADVGSPEDTLALAEAARDAFGGADALVNNAAVADGIGRHSFDEIADEEWERVLRVNLKGVWLCTKAVAPLLREAGAGSIVNIASDTAFSGSPGLAHYVASKAGVLGLTRALARELGPSGIRVNAIAPGFVATEAPDPPTDAATYDTSLTPLRRTAVPDDLFGALAFLISDDSAFVSGQTLLVNGGRVLH
jgi:NAD(P)-dependent dehydrogenase (short-subunit alcohol dehydrogenase family)